MHTNRTPSPERSYKHTKSPWTADRLKKKTKTSPPWKGLPDVLEAEEAEDLASMRSSGNAFELPGPSGQEHEEPWPLNASQEFPRLSTSASVIWPELPGTDVPLAGLHHTSNISASWPNLVQDQFAVNGSMVLQTSLSAECLLQPITSRTESGELSACINKHQPFPQVFKAPHQQSSLISDSETDENKPPLPFNASSMPASLTDRVRHQAKSRISRVKVVRKAAANTSSMQSASLDFDRLSKPMRDPGHNALKPSCAKGITSAFQLSWPPPAAMASSVGVAPANQYPSSLTEMVASEQPLRGSAAGYNPEVCHRSWSLDTKSSQEHVPNAFCLSPAAQGQASQDCSERFSGAMDSDLCMAPVVCDSPALAMAQRSRLQLSHGMPHDSATSLVRLDMHLLPSPLSKGVSVAALGKCEDVHASPHPHGSHDALVWTSEMSHGHATRLAKAPPPQLCLGTHAVPMIISPDEHHEMQCQGNDSEEEFILYSAPLIDSPGSDSVAHSLTESPVPASPDSPADRSILPNSAPGFIISPSPVPFYGPPEHHYHGSSKQTPANSHVTELSHPATEREAVHEVDDVDALNMLLKKWCKLGSDPKDAEEFVDQACKDGRIMPNAATVNNLNKLWDTHEQLHG